MRFFFIILLNILFISILNALTLPQAINLALKHNQELNKKYIDIKIQKENIKTYKAMRFGQIDILTNYNRYDSKRVLEPLSRYRAEDILSYGVQYQIPIFTGFEITENIKISKLNQKLSSITEKLTKNQVIFNVKSIYFTILSLKKQLSAMKDYRTSLNRLYKDVSLKVRVGKKPEVDLYKIEYDLKSTDAAITNLQKNIDTLKYALKEIIGKKDLIIDKIEDIQLTKNFKLIDVNIENIPSVIHTKIQRSIALEKIKKAKSEYFPKIYLNSKTFENYGNGNDVNIWNVSLNLKFNLFDFGKRKSEVKKALLEERKAELANEEVKLKKEKEIKDALNKIKISEADIEAYKNQIKYAKEEERIEKLKYEKGVSQIYDYLYAKSRRYIAESKYYDSLYKREQAIAYYEYVIEKYANNFEE